MNASPARTMIGSARSTQPPAPAVAVDKKPRSISGDGIDSEDGNRLARVNAFEMKTGDDSIVAELKREMRFVMERQHRHPIRLQIHAFPAPPS
jgi:hypothetical protein